LLDDFNNGKRKSTTERERQKQLKLMTRNKSMKTMNPKKYYQNHYKYSYRRKNLATQTMDNTLIRRKHVLPKKLKTLSPSKKNV
jgi:hypothetical protein